MCVLRHMVQLRQMNMVTRCIKDHAKTVVCPILRRSALSSMPRTSSRAGVSEGSGEFTTIPMAGVSEADTARTPGTGRSHRRGDTVHGECNNNGDNGNNGGNDNNEDDGDNNYIHDPTLFMLPFYDLTYAAQTRFQVNVRLQAYIWGDGSAAGLGGGGGGGGGDTGTDSVAVAQRVVGGLVLQLRSTA